MSALDSDAPDNRTPWMRRVARFVRPEGVWFTTFDVLSVLPALLEPTTEEFDNFSNESLIEVTDVIRWLGFPGLVWALLERFPLDRRAARARAWQAAGHLEIEAYHLHSKKVGLRFHSERRDQPSAAPPADDANAPAPTLRLHVSPDGADLMRE